MPCNPRDDAQQKFGRRIPQRVAAVKITFCIITLNEEKNLRQCLAGCSDVADEIVVVDSGSTDGTEEVARKFGARWIHRDWTGYRDQKNHACGLASNEWVFSIDADELMSSLLREEVRVLKAAGPGGVAGFCFPRCVFYEGRWIRHGDWYPDRLVRLFRRHRGRFIGGRVHERLELDGAIRPLRGDLEHYSFRDREDHWERCQKYARLWAEDAYESGRRVGPMTPLLHASFRWLRGYVLRAGFLDGRQGFQIAGICAREVHLKYRLLRERSDEEPPVPTGTGFGGPKSPG